MAMNQALYEQILERLTGSEVLEEGAANLVLAACQGVEALNQALDGRDIKTTSAPAAGVKAPGAFLKSISVTGFRGIGPTRKLELKPGPGLTLVVGRNGSGKSSFAEGLEVLLTGESSRWLNRTRVWREGWQNLHEKSASKVEAEFLLDGVAEPLLFARSWTSESTLEGGRLTGDLERLGWGQALQTYRPFLPYSEISSLLNQKPSEFHDALSAILGLNELVETEKRLNEARAQREKEVKICTVDAKYLTEKLAGLGDPRAIACRGAISGRTWELDILERNLVGDGVSGLEDLGQLKLLSSLTAPDVTDVLSRIDGLVATLATSGAATGDASLATADLLEQALQWHTKHPSDQNCPVCGTAGQLGGDWARRTAAEVQRLRQEAGQAQALRQQEAHLKREIASLCAAPPSVLFADVPGIDLTAALSAWKAWHAVPDDLPSMGRHLREAREPLVQALWAVSNLARAEFEKRNSDWQPVALELTAWLVKARRVEADKEPVRLLAAGEKWLKQVAGELRIERLRPVAEAAMGYYAQLRQDSNVLLRSVSLTGVATQRRVALDVQVDDVEGAALSVMSQGELNALALSLFLPRATLPESPFRFVIIDDPVQAMDPAKVDGLARVLEKAARSHQVLVFTHDARLDESIRRQGIDATVIAVTRRERSVVELRPSLDPVSRSLADASDLARTNKLDRRVASRVVPRFCRDALEAALAERATRQLFSAGRPLEQLEALLLNAPTLNKMAALALTGDSNAVPQAQDKIKRLGNLAWRTFHALNSGSHEAHTGNLEELVRDTRDLIAGVRA